MPTDYRILSHLPFLFRSGWYAVKMKWLGRKERTGIGDYQRLHRIYGAFSQRHRGEFDGSSDSVCRQSRKRAKGVGKTLLSDLLAYWEEHKTRNVYLYTDTTCNYGFYEHQGFVRLEDEALTLTRDGNPFEMRVFLYGYEAGKS